MSTKYDDPDRDRGQRNYGRRSGQDYDGSYGQSSQSGWGSAFDNEEQRYAGESRWRGQYGTGRAMYRGGGDYESRDWGSPGSEDYDSERNRTYGSSGGGYGGRAGSARDYGRSVGGRLGYGGEPGGYGRRTSGGEYGGSYGREYSGTGGDYRDTSYGDEYGSSYGAGYERGEGRYRDMQGGYSRGSNYPGRYRSTERYGQSGRYRDYGRDEYGEGRGYGRGGYEARGGYEGRAGYEGRGGYSEGEERGWWDRLSDTVASWFGDEEAERRRRMERPYQGRGPKGYRRSDERIKEDVNDRLSEGYLDATEIEVNVSGGEVFLTGTVDSRVDKRRAEAIAENVSGVANVENRLRVRNRQQIGTYGTSEASSTMGASTTGTGTTGTGTTATADTGTSATGTGTGSIGTSSGSARGKTAGS